MHEEISGNKQNLKSIKNTLFFTFLHKKVVFIYFGVQTFPHATSIGATSYVIGIYFASPDPKPKVKYFFNVIIIECVVKGGENRLSVKTLQVLLLCSITVIYELQSLRDLDLK